MRRPRSARERRRRAQTQRTVMIGALALTTTAAVVGIEIARVWRRGDAPLPAETDDVLGAVGTATRQTIEVAVEGYADVSDRENAALNLLLAFLATFAVVRAGTYTIRARGEWGPIRNVAFGDRHIHHFVPGILLAFTSGTVALLAEREDVNRWLAIPFGAGVALTLDEAALLLELEDVYWTEQGVLSVHVTLGALAVFASTALALRLLRRGEQSVLDEEPGDVGDALARARAVSDALRQT